MKQITHIRLGAREYTIRWDADSIEDIRDAILDEDDEATASGSVDHMKREICLDPSLAAHPQVAFEVLMHEATHVIEAFLGLDLTEDQVEALAASYVSLLIQSGICVPSELEVSGIPLTGITD